MTTATDSILVALDDVAVGYGRTTVVEHATFAVRAGEAWFWLGDNGAGKTTLVNALLGTLAPRAGKVQRSVTRAQIGYVPQRCDWNLVLPTTAAEFVELGLCGLTGRADRAKVGNALAAVGLPGFEERSYRELSGGQRQRLLLARALVREPRLLVLDEPTNGLDPESEHTLLGIVDRAARERGVGFVFVTHRLDLAAANATHLLRFAGGTVTWSRQR